MTKFNNLKVERVKSNLKYTESKLVKKDHGKRKKYQKSHYHTGITQKKATRKEASRKEPNAKRHHAKRQHAKRHHAKKQYANRHNAKRHRKKGNLQKGHHERSLLRDPGLDLKQYYLVHSVSKLKWYSNETFHLAHLVRCLFGTFGVYYNKSKTELTATAFLCGWRT